MVVAVIQWRCATALVQLCYGTAVVQQCYGTPLVQLCYGTPLRQCPSGDILLRCNNIYIWDLVMEILCGNRRSLQHRRSELNCYRGNVINVMCNEKIKNIVK